MGKLKPFGHFWRGSVNIIAFIYLLNFFWEIPGKYKDTKDWGLMLKNFTIPELIIGGICLTAIIAVSIDWYRKFRNNDIQYDPGEAKVSKWNLLDKWVFAVWGRALRLKNIPIGVRRWVYGIIIVISSFLIGYYGRGVVDGLQPTMVGIDQPPKTKCKWYNVTIVDFEILECDGAECNTDMVYQFTAHVKRKDDTIFTRGPGINNINMTITHNVLGRADLAVALEIKTLPGVTLAGFRNHWTSTDNWGEGMKEVFNGNQFMTYKIRYKIECVE